MEVKGKTRLGGRRTLSVILLERSGQCLFSLSHALLHIGGQDVYYNVRIFHPLKWSWRADNTAL